MKQVNLKDNQVGIIDIGIYNFLHEHENKYPPCLIYGKLIFIACEKYGMNENEARRKCGLFDCGQWIKFLGMN